MPLNPNNPKLKLGGRKGYEFEQAQLEKMRKILDKDLAIIERLQDAEEINPTDERKLAISQARVSKYLDKLHASKETQEITGSLIINIEQEGHDKYANRNTEDSFKGQPPIQSS